MDLLTQIRSMVAVLPPGAHLDLPVDWLRSALAANPARDAHPGLEAGSSDFACPPDAAATWREKLWTAPAETRIGAPEVVEAFGRTKSWLYRHTSAGTIPHRKFDGELVFVVGELRAWAREREEVVLGGPIESTAAERDGWSVVRGGRHVG